MARPKKTQTAAIPAEAATQQGGGPAAADDLLTLRQELADAKAELAITLRVNEELQAEVRRLSKYEPQQKPPAKMSASTFDHAGSTFGFVYTQIRYKGELVTHEMVMASQHLQAELVALGSGMIKKIS